MLKVRLNKTNLIRNLRKEEQLLDESLIESLYAIRKLKGLVESLTVGHIEVNEETNQFGQRFSEEFQVWFNEEEMTEL